MSNRIFGYLHNLAFLGCASPGTWAVKIKLRIKLWIKLFGKIFYVDGIIIFYLKSCIAIKTKFFKELLQKQNYKNNFGLVSF